MALKVQLSLTPCMLLLLFILLSVSLHNVVEADPLIDSICGKTRNRKQCTNCLQRAGGPEVQLTSRDVRGYARVALDCIRLDAPKVGDSLLPYMGRRALFPDLRPAATTCYNQMFWVGSDATDAYIPLTNKNYKEAIGALGKSENALLQGCSPLLRVRPPTKIVLSISRLWDMPLVAIDIVQQLMLYHGGSGDGYGRFQVMDAVMVQMIAYTIAQLKMVVLGIVVLIFPAITVVTATIPFDTTTASIHVLQHGWIRVACCGSGSRCSLSSSSRRFSWPDSTCRQIRSKLEKTNRRSWVARLCMQLTRSVHLRRYSSIRGRRTPISRLCFLAEKPIGRAGISGFSPTRSALCVDLRTLSRDPHSSSPQCCAAVA
ncbi:hypothetical protein Droror1_Dr00016745 [Drosera rotundifolia]